MRLKNKRLVCAIVDDKTTWTVIEEDIPDVPKDGVIVKVLFAGICHSDAHLSQKKFSSGIVLPRVMGHEISGVVFQIGQDMMKENLDFRIGDSVVVYPWGQCGDCPHCNNDLVWCPKSVQSGVDRTSLYGYGTWRDGGFQNYVVIHKSKFIVKVPHNVPLEVACMAPCSGITAYNASQEARKSIERSLKIHGKASVAIIGAGGLGLWAIQFLKVLYPANLTVIAIDVAEEKLEDARAHGADKTFKWGIKDSVPGTVDAFLRNIGEKPDVFIDFTGIQDALLRALALLYVGGTLIMVGLGRHVLPPFPITGTIVKQISLQGIMTGSVQQLKEVLQLLAEHKVRPPPTTLVPLEGVEVTIDSMHKNTVRGRHIVKLQHAHL